jgi:hypothetical protein
MPIAAPAATNRCRQVSTTIISAMPPYSGPGLGGKITSRAWTVIGPGWPVYRRETISSTMRNPRATTLAVAQRITRGRRHSTAVIMRPIRENTRDSVDINCLTDLLVVVVAQASRRAGWAGFRVEGRR